MSAPEIEYPQFHDTLDDIAPPCASTRIFGHEESIARIVTAAKGGTHALILDGEQGIGKASVAFHIANWLLSGAPETADGHLPPLDIASETYRQIAQNAHPNMLYLTRPLRDDGKAFKTEITVGEARKLQRFLGMTSSAGERRVILIDAVSDMNRNAANAMLKLLEEPPANTLFLLISHGMGGLLPTIRSRCQIVRFAPLDSDKIPTVLNHVAGTILDSSEVGQLAAISGGSVRHALLMARNGGLELQESLTQFLGSQNFDTALAHKLADVAGARGNDVHNLLLRQMLFDTLRNKAVDAAQAGDIHRAEQLARFDAQLSERTRTADGFNLDRRQEFLITADQVHKLIYAA